MVKRTLTFPWTTVKLDPQAEKPLHRQLYEELRQEILQGQFPAQTRLPSTRVLAQTLGISRNTVINAFEQLLAEGYLEGRIGDGTYVAGILPETPLSVNSDVKELLPANSSQMVLSQRGHLLATTPITTSLNYGIDENTPHPFQLGLPSFKDFPFKIWIKLTTQYWQNPPYDLLGYSHPAGYQPLREIIANYLTTVRGVCCQPAQVIIVNGAHHAFELIARLLLDPGDPVWLEEPGFIGTRGVFQSLGLKLIPVPVDNEGLDVAAGIASNPQAKLAYITPSHQFPLGVTMPLARRLALLDWAQQHNAWIVEDDYVSEFRYTSRPLAAVQGLDRHNRVIYIGTFSKILLPALRLGYIVVPPNLVDSFINARSLTGGRYSNQIDQAILADFITQGYFTQHLRRMRKLYAERQATLVAAFTQQATDLITVKPAGAGMHLIGWLKAGIDDQLATYELAKQGIEVAPLSSYYLKSPKHSGLLIGYTAIETSEIAPAVAKMVEILTKCQG